MSDNNAILIELLESISGKVDGVNNRLDVLNGRVYKHEKEKAEKTEVRDAFIEVDRKIVDVDKKVLSLSKTVWRLSLYVVAGAAGGVGISEALKIILGG